MLLLSFVEVFRTPQFNAAFNVTRFQRNEAMRWIRASDLGPAQRIVSKMTSKAAARRDPLTDSTINDPDDAVITEMGSRQVSQLFRAALALHTFAVRDQRVHEAFIITFQDRMCSPSYINAGMYLQQVLGAKGGHVLATETPTIFDVLLWFHCVNLLHTESAADRVTVKVSYRVGNILGFVVSRVTSAWAHLIRRMGHEALSAVVAPYMWYNSTTGTFEHLTRSDGFAPTAQRESLLGEGRPAAGGPAFDAAATTRSEAMDHAYRHVSYAMLKKLKDIVCNNELYKMSERQITEWPVLSALHRQHGAALPFAFCEMDDEVMKTLNIPKPVPPPLEIINIEDASTERVGRVTPTVATLLDRSVLYRGNASDEPTVPGRRKRASIKNTSAPRKKRRKNPPGRSTSSNAGATSAGTVVKTEAQTVKTEEDLVDVEPADSLRFDAETNQAYKLLQQELRKYVSFYTCPFTDLAEKHADNMGEELGVSVDFVLTDPPYNIRRTKERPNSDYDSLSEEDMRGVVDVVDAVLVKGGHAVVFCSFAQFPDWCAEFMTLTEDVDVVESVEQDEPGNVEKPVFTVESTPLKFIRARGNYQANPVGKRLTHASMVEVAVHLWKNGLDGSDMLGKVDYSVGSYVPSTLPGWTDTIDNIPRIPAAEVVYSEEVGENGKRLRLCPEQKSVAVMKTLVAQYSAPGGLVLDPFCGTFAVAKACLSLPQHRRCVCGDIDPACVKHGLQQLVEVFAGQVLNEESDINASAEVQDAATTFCNSLRAIQARKQADAWGTPGGLPPLQVFPPHILHFMSSYYGDYSLFHHCKHIPYNQWSSVWRSRFNQLDKDTLLGVDLMYSGLELRQSTIPGAGMGIFTTRRFGVNEVVGHYYGTLVYGGMPVERTRSGTHGEGIMAFNGEEFAKWALELTWTLPPRGQTAKTKQDGTTVWIYPAPFCAMRFINDARRTDKEPRPPQTGTAANVTPDRQNNVRFRPIPRPDNATPLRKSSVVRVVAMVNIPAHTELFVCYGEDFIEF